MKIQPLLQKFGRDLIYLSIIGGLGGWVWMGEIRQEIWNEMAIKDLKAASSMANFMLERYTLALEKGSVDYPSAQSEDYSKRGFISRYLLDTVFMKKLAQFQESITDDSGTCFRSLSIPELKALEKEAWLVTDSVSKLVDGIQEINPKIWNCLFGDDIWLKAQTVTPSQTKLFFQNLEFRSKLLNREALGYFSTKVGYSSSHEFWTPLIPFVEAEKMAPFKGETYYAQIYLSRRYLSDLSTTIKVDGKLLPHGGYGAVFQNIAMRPARKNIPLKLKSKTLSLEKASIEICIISAIKLSIVAAKHNFLKVQLNKLFKDLIHANPTSSQKIWT